MKLASVISLFDAEELLEGAILSVRDQIDLVICVWQDISYFGEENPDVEREVHRLRRSGLIDIAVHFHPELGHLPRRNELAKRQLGVEIAFAKGCTHFLFQDADEYYDAKQFSFAKNLAEIGNYDSTYCQMYTYYKEPVYVWDPIEGYVVPFVCKLKKGIVIGRNVNGAVDPVYPVPADPTRVVRDPGKHTCFGTHQLIMHHFSFVRLDIGRKLRNSAARNDFGRYETSIEKMIGTFENFDPENPKFVLSERTKVKRVEDRFGVKQRLERYRKLKLRRDRK